MTSAKTLDNSTGKPTPAGAVVKGMDPLKMLRPTYRQQVKRTGVKCRKRIPVLKAEKRWVPPPFPAVSGCARGAHCR